MSASRGNGVPVLGLGLARNIFDGFGKFGYEFLLEYSNHPVLNAIRKERWQIDMVEGGVTCADLECDVLGVGCFIDSVNGLEANWAAGFRDGGFVYMVILNLRNLVMSADDHDGWEGGTCLEKQP